MSDADRSQFEDSPRGWANRWTLEFSDAKKWLKDARDSGNRAVRVYQNQRTTGSAVEASEKLTKLNLFYANVQTVKALLYGKPPSVKVKRRFADANDDIARVAAIEAERILTADIERDDDNFATSVGLALSDWLLPGFGIVRCRYVADFESQGGTPAVIGPDGTELAPEVPPQEVKTWEDVETDYVYWQDCLWSPCRVFGDMRWMAFRVLMSREDADARFPDHAGKIPLNAKVSHDLVSGVDAEETSPWARAEVWEIWSKETRTVQWFVEGYSEVLDTQQDPLGLEGFWPFPRPLMSNETTSAFRPIPDYEMARTLYQDADTLASRIAILESSIKVAGAYDKSIGNLASIVDGSDENKLIPIDNWAMFAERGGIKGAIDWFPVDMVAGVLDKLSQKLAEKQALIYQQTGMSDIMRGAAATGGATATEQAIKAKFAGVRTQSKQEEFARFCSDVQKIRYEIICKHFEIETIVQRANMQSTPDAGMAQQAAQLLKERGHEYRVSVDPDSVSISDLAQLQSERLEFLKVFGQIMQMVGPVMQQMPPLLPSVLEIVRWTMAGLRGASTIEGVLDQAIESAKQTAQQAQSQGQKPDPKMKQAQAAMVINQAKTQGDLARTQAKLNADLTKIQAETRANMERQKAETMFNVEEEAGKARVQSIEKGPLL